MRIHKLLIIVALAFAFQNANAQTFGVKAGLNYSTFLGPTVANENHGYSNGFHFGLSYSYDFTDLFSIRTELFYIQNGTTYDYSGGLVLHHSPT